MSCIFLWRHELNESDILTRMTNIKLHYAEFERDQTTCLVHGKRVFKILKEISSGARYLCLDHLVFDILWCTVLCFKMYHAYLCEIPMTYKDYNKCDKRLKNVFSVYSNLHRNCFQKKSTSCIVKIIQYIYKIQLWKINFICVKLLKQFFTGIEEKTQIVISLLDVAAWNMNKNVDQVRAAMLLLQDTIKNCKWTGIDQNMLVQLIEMYNFTVPNEIYSKHFYHSVDLCAKSIINGMEKTDVLVMTNLIFKYLTKTEIDERKVHILGKVLETVALLHKQECLADIFNEDIFKTLLNLIKSDNNVMSLLGNYLFQCLFDRNGNRKALKAPRIFFSRMKYVLAIGKYFREDKIFFKQHRKEIQECFLTAIRNHGQNIENLENIYNSIALLVIEIPCDYSAVAITCLAMNIQSYALGDSGRELASLHRLHATVAAILSLVCLVNKATEFYEYLEEVVTARARNAQFLNPPLQTNYQYAQHQVLWNEPDFFFQNYEVRYKLWKCFRTRKVENLFRTFHKTESHVFLK